MAAITRELGSGILRKSHFDECISAAPHGLDQIGISRSVPFLPVATISNHDSFSARLGTAAMCHSVIKRRHLKSQLNSYSSFHILASSSSDTETRTLDVELESEIGVSYEVLKELLSKGEWEKADSETRRLVIVLAGEEAVKRNWVYFTEVQNMPSKDLSTIDALWRAASGDRFGYTVQRRLWNSASKRWKPFFLKIGWTFGENNTCKKFPMEFTWDIEAPIGHLPLTNTLRGTQLIENLLNHPAFTKFDTENALPLLSDVNPPPPPAYSSVEEIPADEKVEKKKSEGSSVLSEIFNSSDYGF